MFHDVCMTMCCSCISLSVVTGELVGVTVADVHISIDIAYGLELVQHWPRRQKYAYNT